MTLLISGLILFLATHLYRNLFPGFREKLIAQLTLTGYKVVYSFVTLFSFFLIVIGLMDAPYYPVYNPPSWGHTAAIYLMLPAMYFWNSNAPFLISSRAQMITTNPVSWGLIMITGLHLLANGDLAHVILFSTFLIFAVISILVANVREPVPRVTKCSLKREFIFITITTLEYFALLWAHDFYTGVSLLTG